MFLKFLSKKLLLLFSEFELLMVRNNIVKITEQLYKQNLLKISPQVAYPTDFSMFCIRFYYGEKVKIFDLFWLEYNVLCICSYDKMILH